MSKKRKVRRVEFEATVAVREPQTVTQLSSRFGVHAS